MRALTTRRPDLFPLHRDLDDLLGRFFGGSNERLPGVTTGRWIPPLESYFKDGELVVRLDVPGIAPGELDISVDGDHLTVRGERKTSLEEDDKTRRAYREVVYGAFERTVTLPWPVDSENVRAACRDGVLEITIKAPAKVGAKKIEISS